MGMAWRITVLQRLLLPFRTGCGAIQQVRERQGRGVPCHPGGRIAPNSDLRKGTPPCGTPLFAVLYPIPVVGVKSLSHPGGQATPTCPPPRPISLATRSLLCCCWWLLSGCPSASSARYIGTLQRRERPLASPHMRARGLPPIVVAFACRIYGCHRMTYVILGEGAPNAVDSSERMALILTICNIYIYIYIYCDINYTHMHVCGYVCIKYACVV